MKRDLPAKYAQGATVVGRQLSVTGLWQPEYNSKS